MPDSKIISRVNSTKNILNVLSCILNFIETVPPSLTIFDLADKQLQHAPLTVDFVAGHSPRQMILTGQMDMVEPPVVTQDHPQIT